LLLVLDEDKGFSNQFSFSSNSLMQENQKRRATTKYIVTRTYLNGFLCTLDSERWWTSARSDRSCSVFARSCDNWFCRLYAGI